MMQFQFANSGRRLTQWIVALAGIALCGWLALRTGPRPQQESTVANVQRPQPFPTREAEALLVNFAEPSVLAGMPVPLARGESTGTAAEQVAALAKIYVQRGYQRLEANASLKQRQQAIAKSSGRFYWQSEMDGAWLIAGCGTDANPHATASTTEPQLFLTVVTPLSESKVEWATYRGATEMASAPLATESDAPGVDPPEIPRPAGLHRLYSLASEVRTLAIYSTQTQPAELTAWYRQQLTAAGWQFDATATAQTEALAQGAQCYTRGEQLCLVWIAAEAGGEPTSVIISSRFMALR